MKVRGKVDKRAPRPVREIVAEESGPSESWHGGIIGGHVYDGERCIYCNTNAYDPGADEECPVKDRPGYEHTTGWPHR